MKKYFLLAAGFIGTRVGLSFEDQEVVAFGLEVTFSIFISLLLALLFGLWWKIVPEILVVALVWMLIRSFAGGAHLSTLWRCTVSSTMVMVALGGAAKLLSVYADQKVILALILFCGVVALIFTSLWAPADNSIKRIAEKYRQNFRHKALAVEIIVLAFLLSVYFITGHKYSSLLSAAGLAMGAEGLTVSPGGYRAMAAIDRMLELLEKIVLRGGEKG